MAQQHQRVSAVVAAIAALATYAGATADVHVGPSFECALRRDLCGFDHAAKQGQAETDGGVDASDCCVTTVPAPPNMNNCGGWVHSSTPSHTPITIMQS